MLENILTTISKLKGVRYACLYRDGEDILSTFPKDFQNINSLTGQIEQIFFALQAIDKGHDELYFSVDDQLLAAYLMYDSYIAILLTDKKINFPLIHMGIRSASSKIKRQVSSSSEKQIISAGHIAASSSETDQATNKTINQNLSTPVNAELQSILDALLEELINYFGPAAKFVFEDAIIQWETKYVKSKDNIPELSDILLKELDTSKEKNEFSQFVEKILE